MRRNLPQLGRQDRGLVSCRRRERLQRIRAHARWPYHDVRRARGWDEPIRRNVRGQHFSRGRHCRLPRRQQWPHSRLRAPLRRHIQQGFRDRGGGAYTRRWDSPVCHQCVRHHNRHIPRFQHRTARIRAHAFGLRRNHRCARFCGRQRARSGHTPVGKQHRRQSCRVDDGRHGLQHGFLWIP